MGVNGRSVGVGTRLVAVPGGVTGVGVAGGSLGRGLAAAGPLVGVSGGVVAACAPVVGVAGEGCGVREGVAVATIGSVALPCTTASVDSQAS